jgi:AcrR family transcriptional regulator
MAARKASKRRAQLDHAQLKRQQILEAFSAKAKRDGLRNVMMGELASELRMSASTLYKLYPSKEALALACVDRWARELGASEAAEASRAARRSGFEGFMDWVDAWADANARLSPAFRRDLKSDYPAAWRRYLDVIQQLKTQGMALLRPSIKPELESRVAFAVLNMILEQVTSPEFADRLGISRHEALRSAVTIWAAGAVDRRAPLRALPKRD